MVAKSILHGWLIFFSIAIVITGFMFVKEGGLRKPKPFTEAMVIDQEENAALADAESADPELIDETETPAPTPLPEGGPILLPIEEADDTQTSSSNQPPADEVEATESDTSSEPSTTFSQVLPTVTRPLDLDDTKPNQTDSEPQPTAQDAPKPQTPTIQPRQDCKLLANAPDPNSRSLDQATSIYTYQLAPGQQITVPFPARIVKVYQSAHSGHTLQLASLDGSRALMIGGFSADLQTLRMQLPLDCGSVLAPLAADNKLHIQLRDTSGKEWWEGDIIDPAELF